MKLSVIHADGSAETVAIDRDLLLVGRLAACDVQLQSARVSRRHAEIRRFGEVFYIKDLGSAAGTAVAGRQLASGEACEFAPGCEAVLADCRLVLTEESAPAPVPASAPAAAVPVPGSASAPAAPAAQSDIPASVRQVLEETCSFYTKSTTRLVAEFREEIRERLNLKEQQELSPEALREKVKVAIRQILVDEGHRLPLDVPKERFERALMDAVIDYGPITPLLREDVISEVMVNGPNCIFIEAKGRMYETGITFCDEEELLMVIRRIVEPLGRHVDDASPMVDARLPEGSIAAGSRVNAVIRPLSLGGAALTIRKFKKDKLTVSELCGFGSLTPAMAAFLEEAVRSRQNIVVSGGTGSGKTTLLNVLSQFIPENERVITVEDAAELQLSHRNLVRMEARPPNIEGKGRVTIRDLVINTLRMRPDRIIVGECRGAEALDMLQAMNTGHDGSLTTLHANNPREALTRLENMVMMAGYDLPIKAIREQIASAVKLIVQQTRLPDGSRKIVRIEEVDGIEGETILTTPIFEFVEQRETTAEGERNGYHRATQNIPKFITALKEANKLTLSLSVFAQ